MEGLDLGLDRSTACVVDNLRVRQGSAPPRSTLLLCELRQGKCAATRRGLIKYSFIRATFDWIERQCRPAVVVHERVGRNEAANRHCRSLQDEELASRDEGLSRLFRQFVARKGNANATAGSGVAYSVRIHTERGNPRRVGRDTGWVTADSNAVVVGLERDHAKLG